MSGQHHQSQQRYGQKTGNDLQLHRCRVADGLHFLVREPREENPEPRPPLLLFLHGSGERGGDLDKVKRHGPWRSRGSEPFLVVGPQCPTNKVWPALVDELHEVLNDVDKNFPYDRDRIYVTGLSLGGFGTWALVTEYPDLFAAAAPVCGGVALSMQRVSTTLREVVRLSTGLHACSERKQAVERCRDLPIWLFHGKKDRVVDYSGSKEAFEVLGGVPTDRLRFTTYDDTGHGCWYKAYGSPEFYEWLLSHRRRPWVPPAKKANLAKKPDVWCSQCKFHVAYSN